MTHRHLTEEQLIATTTDDGSEAPETVSCDICRERLQSLRLTLNEVSETATLAADTAFPPERLARQRARILARIERYGQQARVLAFPSSHRQQPTMRPRPLRRWVAAAAAAGLFVGVVAGRTVRDIPSLHVPTFAHLSAGALAKVETAPSMVRLNTDPAAVSFRASSETVTDDELLQQIEFAVASAGPNALRPIEDVTPVAWEAQ
jgi:hypothetical protein